ncbi:MAG: UDP-N-acetylmuramoyl-tripeptide--D-alanyl-D-alanine ligase [Actinomycetota bacterium]
MNPADPFAGYSILLRTLIYGVLPLFGAFQFVRLRRALHIYQLESYKRHWFLRWCRENRSQALFLKGFTGAKKPLVMTGRAWRMLIAATALSVVSVLVPAGLVHIWLGGWPLDVIAFIGLMAAVFLASPRLLLAGDLVMTPVQKAINAGFLRRARRRLDELDPIVIGVTGSFGKTSTKAAIAHLLGPRAEVLATPGSFNTTLGVSRTINENLTPSHRYFVVEMGARQAGDIAEIASFVKHRIAVLTAIGPAHLETFGSIDGVRKAKSEILTTLPPDGIAVLNVDDPNVRSVAVEHPGMTVVRYGIEADGHPDITVEELWIVERGTAMTIVDRRSGDKVHVKTKLLGRHAVGHVLAAVAVATAVGRTLGEMKDAIESMEPVEHRLQIIEGTGGVTVIDDAYNSNPAGAAAALEVLAQMPGRRKVVVTPGMVELGAEQAKANTEFGRHAATVADTLIVVAKLNRAAIVAGARSVDGDCDVVVVDSLTEATHRLQGLLAPGDVVLFENDLPDQYEI